MAAALMAWIESHLALGGHFKTRKLARLLAASRPAAVGHLHYLWWWSVEYAPTGDLSRFDDAEIAEAAGWEGDPAAFVRGLVAAGFLDADEAGLSIHDHADYLGKLADQRRANAERQRRWRERDNGNGALRVTPTPSDVTVTSRSRNGATEQYRTGQNTTGGDPPVAPPSAPVAPPEPRTQTEDAVQATDETRLRPVAGRKPPRTTTVPEGFAVTPEMRSLAEGYGLAAAAVDRETEKFLDHFRASGGRKTDWAAAWRNWMRRAVEMGRPAARASPNGRAAGPRDETARALDYFIRVGKGEKP